ncbi:MAG: hypothetical protein KC502_18855 [Myxococcales bacterium]|nr:hypothetical protein [Myxococcales bacterium]
MNRTHVRGIRFVVLVFAMAVTAACSNDGGAAAVDAVGEQDTVGTVGDTQNTADTGMGDVATSDGGDESDATLDVIAAEQCPGLNETGCKAHKHCQAIFGKDACDDSAGADKIFAGCMPIGGGCGGALTCGEKDGKRLVFPSTCQPEGWTPKGMDISQCCKSAADPKEWSTCSQHMDCAVFETACCDHCNGGKLMSVGKKFVDLAKAKHQKTDCQGTACTEKGCGKAIAVCDSGVCKGKADPAFVVGCAKLSEADCGASPSCAPLFAHDPAPVCANKPSATKTFAGCMKSDQGCGDALTCASKDGKLSIFMSTCLGEGFVAEKWETCCKSGGDDGCDKGNAANLSKVCVRPKNGGKDFKAGEAVEVVVYPKGCMSSSCTKVHKATCTVSGKTTKLSVAGQICLEGTGGPGQPCTADCNGGGYATCSSEVLAAGDYTLTLDKTSVNFKVPSSMKIGGVCAGTQF